MKLIANAADAPENYTEFYEQYFPYVSGFLFRLGTPTYDLEDTTQEIMLKMIEKDILNLFDPTHEIEYNGKKVKPRFQTFVNSFVVKYHMGIGQREQRYRNRNPLVFDAPINDAGLTFGETSVAFHVSAEEAYFNEAESPKMAALREHLSSLKISRTSPHKYNVRDVTYWDVFLVLGYYQPVAGKKSGYMEHISETYGISTTAASNWGVKVRNEADKFLKSFSENG